MANQSLQDEMRENAVDQRMKENKRAIWTVAYEQRSFLFIECIHEFLHYKVCVFCYTV